MFPLTFDLALTTNIETRIYQFRMKNNFIVMVHDDPNKMYYYYLHFCIVNFQHVEIYPFSINVTVKKIAQLNYISAKKGTS